MWFEAIRAGPGRASSTVWQSVIHCLLYLASILPLHAQQQHLPSFLTNPTINVTSCLKPFSP